MEDKSLPATILSQFVTDRRMNRMIEVLNFRTRYITVVLEDIFQSHNAAAVLRTCDCFGIQDVHIIENRYAFSHHPDIELGASQWLRLHRYNSGTDNTGECIKRLKESGYRIVATVPGPDTPPIGELDITKGKIALLFGTEKEGLSKNAINTADEQLKIPMYGFTQSLNLSVTAALCIYDIVKNLRASEINYLLTEKEKKEILSEWLKRRAGIHDESSFAGR
ncbi:MAG: RNA methyltransferase [Bacteroidetes bacterium]|nr:RNA methyltransferase [Bacteroidota bacterium]